jgi:hypothetical protein
MDSKKCNKCGEEKKLSEFHKGNDKYGYQYTCKVCKYIYSTENKEKENERKSKWKLKNIEKVSLSKKKYYELNKDKEIKRNTHYSNEKKKIDINFKLSCLMRSRLISFIKLKSYKKTNKTFNIVGCSPEKLKFHLENLFTDGMCWENHGIDGWHIDHIIPLSSAKNKKEICDLSHYSNLQPLWSNENLKKGSKIL